MGVPTRVYEIEGDLAINIPTQVLPPSKTQLVEERIEIPGHPDISSWYDVLVRPYKGRTALLLTPHIGISEVEAMSRLGFDTSQPLEIRPYGFDRWVRAHLYHGRYVRVWVPREVTRRTRMREYTTWPVLIRGITLPTYEIRLVERYVKTVVVKHMDREYPTENYAVNKWRWRLPREIECYPVLIRALEMRIYPEALCHLEEEKVNVDFVFTKASARVVSEAMGYAFRNMAVRNYTATVEVDYPFLCEIRATYLSCCPLLFYQPDREHNIRLKNALEITVYNILQYFFQKAKPEYPYSTMSWADHIDKIDFTTTAVKLRRTYPRLSVDEPWKDRYLDYTAEGEGVSEEFGIEEKRYYQCIKYVRVLNEASYQEGGIDRYVYLNDEIENILNGKQHERITKGLSIEVDIDINGFIWKT